jgi:DNA-binding transcriptional MerR regulator
MFEQPLSIGEVISLLRDEFPDVSVSKIRFLESQGLLSPSRSESGYRLFAGEDMRRLRYILGLQRDHFLPLKVIKSKLTLWERGDDGDGAGGGVDSAGSLPEQGEPLTRSDILRRSGLTAEQMQALVEGDLLIPRAGDVFPAWALAVAIEARHLLAAGLEPRHLRTIRLSVDREAELLRQALGPLLRLHNPEARNRSKKTLEASAEAVQIMHRVLLNAAISDLIQP